SGEYVMEGMVGGTDAGQPFTGVYVPLFTDSGKPTALKYAKQARCELVSGTSIKEKLGCLFDFDVALPPPPDIEPVPVGNEWDNAVWDESVWSASQGSIITKRRHSVNGHGYRLAPVLQITSGSAIPLDVQIVAVDVLYETADIFS
ncbi:MAG TPA: hypothetical protein VIK82_03485, partial [Porticoccaceae bacterium]